MPAHVPTRQMLLVIALVAAWLVPAWAEEPAVEPKGLDLHLLALTDLYGQSRLAESDPQDDDRFRLDLAQRIIWDAEYSETLRLAIWDSPLGRADYDLTLAQRGLGMTGLVGAGSSFPFFPRFALRDTLTPQIVLSNGHMESWHEISTDHRIQVGIEAAVAAGALWAIVEGLSN